MMSDPSSSSMRERNACCACSAVRAIVGATASLGIAMAGTSGGMPGMGKTSCSPKTEGSTLSPEESVAFCCCCWYCCCCLIACCVCREGENGARGRAGTASSSSLILVRKLPSLRGSTSARPRP